VHGRRDRAEEKEPVGPRGYRSGRLGPLVSADLAPQAIAATQGQRVAGIGHDSYGVKFDVDDGIVLRIDRPIRHAAGLVALPGSRQHL